MTPKISLQKIKPKLMGSILKKETKFTNKCNICGMEFTNPERTKKHMIKAHTKPKREKRY